MHIVYLKLSSWAMWVMQSIRHPTLDFSSGHQLGGEIEPQTGLCAQQRVCLSFSLSLSLNLSLFPSLCSPSPTTPPTTHTLSKKKKKFLLGSQI